jgi:hypothetical protein
MALRDRRFRRVPGLRVRSPRAALAFVQDIGFCSTFYRFADGVPCLWEAVAGRAAPRWPRHSHHDEAVGLTWRLKDDLPAARHVYYGKVLRGRPCLVALDVFPAFYALVRGTQRARDYRMEYDAGRLTLNARRIMDALTGEHPQYTRSLRASAFMLEARQTREFERAMTELQQGLWVVKTEERYEPSFSYRWDLLESWLPAAVAAGRRLSRAVAAVRLVERYARAAIFTRPAVLRRLFGLSAEDVGSVVRGLTARGVLVDTEVGGWPGRWLVHETALHWKRET